MEYFNFEEKIYEDKNCSGLCDVKQLLNKENLQFDNNVDFTIGIYNASDEIIGTGSIDGKILKCIAVDKEYKSLGISNKIVSDLISEEFKRGNSHLFIYTKPKNRGIFEDMGFYPIAEVKDKVILLENIPFGINEFVEELKEESQEYINTHEKGIISSIVVNCNPFTLGHKYLIEKASKESDIVHLFVVSEDKSSFPSDVRYKLVKMGIKNLKNVVLHKTHDYIISNATFPSYFLKKPTEAVKIHTMLDLEIFRNYIVPALHINRRYVGEEPTCQVTDSYNKTMQEILPEAGVTVMEIPRLSNDNVITSASGVRRLLKEGDFSSVKKMVPQSTFDFLVSVEGRKIINKL